MKYQKPHKAMDEREKLRKFRELDDAFAEALRELEGITSKSSASPKIEETKSSEERRLEQERENQLAFERRLKALMQEYALPEESVTTLMRTLVELGKIA
ncbi:hypothetical protein L861_18080 [Litchfieldella anticariensis FP35 = DSM 16096]|uniref:Uncharacterized protein n=1 Tax=Litchfieldella anticariensis (strain DSM 16096 / CECT 5854 / CIP 108499 / LMG 22089 / FP35) TaxID=1121939 RepID=S2KMV9_LITA3|nr:hypothetical protein [Halomonas anticariensis]EPC03447.1 hypothetical protein L861_18080 [Halomonas anticariensis FP35 = DSM 16096]